MGHGPLLDGHWWACDYPERHPDGLCMMHSTGCRACLITSCALGVQMGDFLATVGPEMATAFGLVEGDYIWWSEALPLLAEHHNLPLRFLTGSTR